MSQLNILLSIISITFIILYLTKKSETRTSIGPDYAVVQDSITVLGSEGFAEYTQPPNSVIVDIYAVPLDTFSGSVEAWVSLENDHTGNGQEIVAPTVVVTTTPHLDFLLPMTDYQDANYPNANLLSAPAFTENTERTVYFGIDTTGNDEKQMQFIITLYEYKISQRDIISPYCKKSTSTLQSMDSTILPRTANPSGCPIVNGCYVCGNGQEGCSNRNSCRCPLSFPRWWNGRCKRLWPSNEAAGHCATTGLQMR